MAFALEICMFRFRVILVFLIAFGLLNKALATTEESYYFQDDEKLLKRLEMVTLDTWPSSTSMRQYKFDLNNLPLNKVLDSKLKTLLLLTYESVILINSNLEFENQLSNWIVNGDPSIDPKLQGTLKARAALVLYKLTPQHPSTLRQLLIVFQQSPSFRMRQILAGIFVKASPRLAPDMVDVLKVTMKNDPDSPTRSLATLAVILNSENNQENLKEAVAVMMEDHKDIMHMLQPWSVVHNFIDQTNNRLLETPTRAISPQFKAKILDLVEAYNKKEGVLKNSTSYTKFKLLLLRDM